MTNKELIKMALKTLRHFKNNSLTIGSKMLAEQAIEALRTALAQPEPEPVAWKVWAVHNHIFFSVGVQTFQIKDVLEHEPEVSAKEFSEWLANQLRHALTLLSTAPPQREWVGLTRDQVSEIWVNGSYEFDPMHAVQTFARAVEAKLKEKNSD